MFLDLYLFVFPTCTGSTYRIWTDEHKKPQTDLLHFFWSDCHVLSRKTDDINRGHEEIFRSFCAQMSSTWLEEMNRSFRIQIVHFMWIWKLLKGHSLLKSFCIPKCPKILAKQSNHLVNLSSHQYELIWYRAMVRSCLGNEMCWIYWVVCSFTIYATHMANWALQDLWPILPVSILTSYIHSK